MTASNRQLLQVHWKKTIYFQVSRAEFGLVTRTAATRIQRLFIPVKLLGKTVRYPFIS